MSRIRPLSGFPEWLPPQRMIEQSVLDHLRTTFELYGFAPLETRAVEPLDQLLRKGETSNEVYVLRRLQADADDASDDKLGLHFDLTVPFARYVLENAGKLQFPFRRYQIQKAWRGERPQEGRYREFLQADIDVVGKDELPFHYDVEIPLIIGDALRGLPIPDVRIQVNNRKLCQGYLPGSGHTRPRGGAAGGGQGRQAQSGGRGRTAGRYGRCHRGPGQGVPRAGGDLGRGHVVRRRRPGAGRERSAPRRGSGRAGTRRGGGPGAPARTVGRRSQDRPWSGLLHRHRVRDPHAWLRARRVDLFRGAVRQPRLHGHPAVPGRRNLDRGVPDARRALRRGRPVGVPAGAHLRARRTAI